MSAMRAWAPALTMVILVTCLIVADEGEPGSKENPFVVPRAASEIRIDAVLDEAAWSDALVFELPFEVWPGDNLPAQVKTECYITYDEKNVYAAFRAYDDDVSAIRAYLTDHDRISTHDSAGIMIDTFNDGRRAYLFYVNPLGVQYDGTRDDLSEGEDSSWDAIWNSAGRITEDGYLVEMAVSFDQIRFQRAEGAQVWGFNAIRIYSRDRRRQLSNSKLDRNVNGSVRQWVKIEGFEGAKPGRNVQITPTLTAVRTDARSAIPGGDFEELNSDAEFGLTASWGFTRNLTLSGTANPDFSQVEADSLQLDINQPFALFYREKRPFFTEGQDYFQTPIDTVHTRTMRDPEWGLKLTGKEGSNALGAYIVQDNVTNLIFPGAQGSSSTSLQMNTLATVLRYRRDFSGRHTAGLLLTDREGDDYFNRVFGFDGTFRLTDVDTLNMQFLGSSTSYPENIAAAFGQPREEFGDRAMYLEYSRNTRTYLWFAEYRERGEGFRADLGYLPQVGIKRGEIGGGYSWTGSNEDWYSRIEVGANWDKTAETNGDPFEEEWEGYVYVQGPYQSEIVTGAGFRGRWYKGVKFDQNFLSSGFGLKPTGNLSLGINCSYDDTIDFAHARAANSISIYPEISYRFGRHLNISLDYTFQRLEVEGQRLYFVNASDLSVVYQLNVRTFFRAIFQFTDIRRNLDLYAFPVEPITKDLFTQLLFSYKINPQTVLFLGYSDNYLGTRDFSITQTDHTFFIKIGYAWIL